jgi:hypothetical protein
MLNAVFFCSHIGFSIAIQRLSMLCGNKLPHLGGLYLVMHRARVAATHRGCPQCICAALGQLLVQDGAAAV